MDYRMDQATTKRDAEQDLLGFIEGPTNNFVPLHKMLTSSSEKTKNNVNNPLTEHSDKIEKSTEPATKNLPQSTSIDEKKVNSVDISGNSIVPEKIKLSLSNKVNKQMVLYKKQKQNDVKTVLVTKDQQRSYIVINDKILPITMIPRNQVQIENLVPADKFKESDSSVKINSNPVKNDGPVVQEEIELTKSEDAESRTTVNLKVGSELEKESDTINNCAGSESKMDLVLHNGEKKKSNLEIGLDSKESVAKKGNNTSSYKKLSKKQGNTLCELYIPKRIDTEIELMEEEDRKVQKEIRKSYNVCNKTILKHKGGLLEIIQNLTSDNICLRKGLRIIQRKLTLMNINKTELDILNSKYEQEVEHLKKVIEELKSEKTQTDKNELEKDLNNKKELIEIGIQVDLGRESISENIVINTEIPENDNNIVNINYSNSNDCDVMTIADKEGENPTINVDFNTTYCTPNISNILYKDINMGVELEVPKVIAVNNGNGIEMSNSMDSNYSKIMYICYKLCDKFDEMGDCPIHIAVMNNDLDGVSRQCKALSMRKLSVDIENSNGYTPLQLAILHKVSTAIVQILISNKASFTYTDVDGNNAFHLAAQQQYLRELYKSELISNTEGINSFNYQGYTPLMVAVKSLNYEDANILILLKADINLQDKKTGKTALFHAVESNSLDLVNLLMDNGAETWRTNFSGHRLQDTISEMDISVTLKKLFSDLDEASMRKSKRLKPQTPLTFVSKRVKI